MDNAGYNFHQSFVLTFYSCMNIKLNLPIMLALCLMLSKTYYAQNYAGIMILDLATYHGFLIKHHIFPILISPVLVDVLVIEGVSIQCRLMHSYISY